MPSKRSLTYRDAGVDIDAGHRLVDRIGPAARSTHRAGVMGGLGGFGGLFELPTDRFREPVLVSGTDGVGTKLRLAIETGRHRGVGVDLVAMCVNDILVPGAEPLFFLDYYATGHLEVDVAGEVVDGIAEGCRQAGCALLGGETAELPGMYAEGDYDLAGFAVGAVEKARIIDGSGVHPGDAVIGLASSGPHANGYSLIRRILADTGTTLDRELDGEVLGDQLLRPTRIYTHAVLKLLETVPVNAIAHVTGGGLPDNLPRVLPEGLGAEIDSATWDWPVIFRWLQDSGEVADEEMWRTFNCGIGLCLCVPADVVQPALQVLGDSGERARVIGRVTDHATGGPRIVIR